MKYSNLSVWLLGLTLIMAGACGEKGSGNDDKIQELEQKISQLEQNQVVTPSSAQNVQPADPATVGAFGFEEEIFDFGTIDEGKVVEHVLSLKMKDKFL